MKTLHIFCKTRGGTVLLTLFLSACSSGGYHPASAALCAGSFDHRDVARENAGHGTGWTGDRRSLVDGDDNTLYALGVMEPAGKPQTDPPRLPTYWVILTGSEYWKTNLPQGEPSSRPMLYTPASAWIEVNGVRVYADKMAIRSASDDNLHIPDPSVIQPISRTPLDLSLDTNRRVLIGFPIEVRAEVGWVLHLGDITVGSVVIPLARHISCMKPAWREQKNLWQM
jgi:hypothetical protein